jgi:hypothetical protein
MFWVRRTFDDENGDHYVELQLWSSCCKEVILFKRIDDNHYFDMRNLDDATPQWNEHIKEALSKYNATKPNT